jgi:putative ABC transport system permease protein
MRDLHHTLRGLRRHPAFPVTAVVTLAIGIGLATTMFSVVHALLLKRLPFEAADRLMAVHLLVLDPRLGPDTRRMVWSYPKYRDFRAMQTTFQNAGLYRPEQWNLTGTGTPERLLGEEVTGSYLVTLGARPQLGRLFTVEEDEGTAIGPIAIIGHSVWTRRYGADPDIIGKTIDLGGTPHPIVGVMEPGFRGLTGASDVWVPVTTTDAQMLSEAWSHAWSLVARLTPGANPETARASVELVGQQLADAYPSPVGDSTWGAAAEMVEAGRVDPATRRSVLILFGAVTFVLLICCVNLAGLLLARAATRRREIAIRLALGSSRWRLVRQLLLESGVLGLAGAAGGVALAFGATGLLAHLSPAIAQGILRDRMSGLTAIGLDAIGVDLTVLAFALACGIVTAIAFGLAPALHATRTSVQDGLKRASTTRASRRLGGRHWLVAAEVALAVVLLAGAGLLVKSLAQLLQTPTGIRPDNVLTIRFALPSPQYAQGRSAGFVERLLANVRALPGVREAGVNSCAPLSGACGITVLWFRDRPEPPRGTEPAVGTHFITPGYIEALGIPLVRGRLLEPADRPDRPKVVLVSGEAAQRLWPGEDPIGKPVALGVRGFDERAEVVGVVGDVRYAAIERAPGPDVYLPIQQAPRTSFLLFARFHGAAGDLTAAVRRVVRDLDPDLPLGDVKTMDERVADASARTRLTGLLLALFAAVAMLLAGIGLYGSIAYVVEQRTREIGIRMALGADRSAVRRLVVSRGMGMALTGVALGLVGAYWLLRLLEGLLHDVKPGDPVALLSAAGLLLLTAAAASYVPARRASRVDPLVALRAE